MCAVSKAYTSMIKSRVMQPLQQHLGMPSRMWICDRQAQGDNTPQNSQQCCAKPTGTCPSIQGLRLLPHELDVVQGPACAEGVTCCVTQVQGGDRG